MFYVVFPFVRGWIEGYFDSLELARGFVKSVGFTGSIFLSDSDEFVMIVKPY